MIGALGRDLTGLALGSGLLVAGFLTGNADSGWLLLALAAFSLWVVIEDALTFEIADGAILGIAATGLIIRMLRASEFGETLSTTLILAAVETAIAGGALWLLREIWFRRKGFDGLGLGDVKLAAAAALVVGAGGFSAALALASLAGIGFAFTREQDKGSRIAFGALLAPAVLLVHLLQAFPTVALLIGGRP
jgi:leader peptidase (prepilin peptidase) / N-methyltransferase